MGAHGAATRGAAAGGAGAHGAAAVGDQGLANPAFDAGHEPSHTALAGGPVPVHSQPAGPARPQAAGAAQSPVPGQSAVPAVPPPAVPLPAELGAPGQPAAPAARPRWPSVVARGSGAVNARPAGAQGAQGTGGPGGSGPGRSGPGAQPTEDAGQGNKARGGLGSVWNRGSLGGRGRWSTLVQTGGGRAGGLLLAMRKRPLETVAVALLGVGGVIYPPVWLLGAAVALFSKAWDYRDKWIGLGGTVLLAVVGTDAWASLGGHAAFVLDVHRWWLHAGVVSRVAAVIGTVYLVWRLNHAWRVPEIPPWNKPHRVG
jgi:hypothetical protein